MHELCRVYASGKGGLTDISVSVEQTEACSGVRRLGKGVGTSLEEGECVLSS